MLEVLLEQDLAGRGGIKMGHRMEKYPGFPFQGEKDWEKYEVARRLKDVVHTIRAQYRKDWESKEIKKQQRAVALYFIDKVSPASPCIPHPCGSWEFTSLIQCGVFGVC